MSLSRTTAAVLSAAMVATAIGSAPAVGSTTPRVPLETVIVAPDGSDSAAGTVEHPVHTVAEAVSRLPDGGRIQLRGGTYHQRVRLVDVTGITVEPYRSERPVLSGAGLTPTGTSALVEIADSRSVTVRGLDLKGYYSDELDVVPIGIWVHGHGRQITVSDNRVHHLGNTNGTLGSYDINAHGIAVYGDDPAAAIKRLTITGNRVHHLQLGASESVVVNGNVRHWAITKNKIHDNNNIGIDAIGYESTLTGPARWTNKNRARDGVIARNVVKRIKSAGNPAYWEDGEWCNCADGIYVDGGTRIRIAKNVVRHNDIGVEIAAENARGSADHVTVVGNKITGSLFTGLATGGYCNGAEDCGGERTGRSHDNRFVRNHLRGNNRADDGSPEILIQYYAWGNVFAHNHVAVTSSGHDAYGTVDGDRQPAGHRPNVSDHNRFCVTGAAPSALRFGWRGHVYRGPVAFTHATGQDQRSRFARC